MSHQIKSGILGFSFDKYPSSSIADAKVKEKAEGYRRSSSRCVSHLIYRCPISFYTGEKVLEIDNLKFNYLLDGVPIAAYQMINLINSDLQNIAVVGSKEIRMIFEMIREANADKLTEKNLVFAEEGEELSLYNTIQKGKAALAPYMGKEENRVSLHTGDTPLAHNIDSIVYDQDAKNHDFVLDLNCRELIFSNSDGEFTDRFEFFRRNYYWKLKEANGYYSSFKEANVYIINLDKTDGDLIKFITGTRKGGSLGLVGLIANAITREPSKTPGLILYGLLKGNPFHNIFLQGLHKAAHWITFKQLFNSKFIKKTNRQFLEGIGARLTGGKVKIKTSHKDFARLADIDSLEDWRFYEELIDYAKKEYGGLNYIYPYAEDIASFKERYSKELRASIPMHHDFKAFANERFSRFGLFEPYPDGSLEFISHKSDLEAAVEHLHNQLFLTSQAQS